MFPATSGESGGDGVDSGGPGQESERHIERHQGRAVEVTDTR